MLAEKPKKGKAKPVATFEPAALPPLLLQEVKPVIADDDDDDDDSDLDSDLEVAPPKSVAPPSPGCFEASRFRSREDRSKNQYPAKIIPQWCEWVCTSSNEVRVLAQIAYTFREGGSRLYKKDGYRVTYQRYKKLKNELPPMTYKQVKLAVQGLIERGILVEMGWRENNRLLRIDADRVAELVAEWEAKGSSK